MANKLMLKVRTFDLKTGELDSDKEIDYNAPGTEAWLKAHCIWAWYHGKGVQTCNVRDWSD